MNKVRLLAENSPEHIAFVKTFKKLGADEDIFSFDYTSEELNQRAILETVYLDCSTLLSQNDLFVSDLILLRANGNQDGHALTLGSSVVTFFDLVAYIVHIQSTHFDNFSHLLHEMFHASHYKMNYSLDPLSLTNCKNLLGVKSIIEGVCVYSCNKINPDGDNYWFGFLEKEELDKWVQNCEQYYLSDIQAIKTNDYSNEQKVNLLGLNSFSHEDRILGRRAYYQVSKALDESNLEVSHLIQMSFDEILEII